MTRRIEANSNLKGNFSYDDVGVIKIDGHESFGYSDGRKSEIYLFDAISEAKDISSNSIELETKIYDWITEYHLSRKRSQLLSGFSFEKELSVLEVGCGCGAITRFLGENFAQVTSIEGNIHRARIAKARCRDLPNVSVICAPFESIEFHEKFDLIICVGVYEYSGQFVTSQQPYHDVLSYFSKSLTDNGHLLIAIENQFGLKYFTGAREDHVGVRFEGIAGYPSSPNGVRTFGKVEISENIGAFFRDIKFYYPFPDYKLPTAVFSEEFLKSSQSIEVLSRFKSRDYFGIYNQFVSEEQVAIEIGKNHMMDFFSNSFIIIAAKDKINYIKFDQSGILFSDARSHNFDVISKINKIDNKTLITKNKRYDLPEDTFNKISLNLTSGEWIDNYSLEMQMKKIANDKNSDLHGVFSNAILWYNYLLSCASEINGRPHVPGGMVDAIWGNAFYDGESVRLIDQEYVFHQPVSVNAVAIRAVFNFLIKLQDQGLGRRPFPEYRSGRALLAEAGKAFGASFTQDDIYDFIMLESSMQAEIYGIEFAKTKKFISWFLSDRPSLDFVRRSRSTAIRHIQSARARLSTLFS